MMIHWHYPEHRFSCLISVSSMSEHQKLPSVDKVEKGWFWQSKVFSCRVEVTDTLVSLFWMHSCRSSQEEPFFPSKIISERSINQNNSENMKDVLQSRVLKLEARFSANIRCFVPHIASHVGGEGAKAEFVLF